ncbi:MAG: hypothetical protein WC223_09225 [Bacteroidales bacterium]
MDSKDELIIEMLKNGNSYTDIQAELKVSPSRIAIIKKQYLNTPSSTNNALLQNNSTNNIKLSEHKKPIEKEGKPKEKVVIKSEVVKKENITDFLTTHEEEFKNFVKDIITTSLDNSATRNTTIENTTTDESNAEEWANLYEKILNDEKNENAEELVNTISATTENLNTTTENNTNSSEQEEKNSDVQKLIGQKCTHCGKTFRKGMRIVYTEGKYFCSIKCYRLYKKIQEEKREREYRLNNYKVYKRRRRLNDFL